MIMKENKLFGPILLILAIFTLNGCAPKNNESREKLYSNQSYDTTQLNILILSNFKTAPVLPDEKYQLVNEAALKNFYEYYKSDLFNKGVTKWDSSFDCNRFALYYQALAQITYYRETFGKRVAQSIAVGEVYYKSDKSGGGHAINMIITPTRILFVEPQTGEEIILTKKRKRVNFLY